MCYLSERSKLLDSFQKNQQNEMFSAKANDFN